jgi:integrase
MHLLKPNGKNPYYRGRFTLGHDPREYEVSLRTKDKEVAWERLKRQVGEREREDVGLLAPKAIRDAQSKPIGELHGEFLDDLRATGKKNDYVRQVKNRFRVLVRECGWKTWRDITTKSLLDWRKDHGHFSGRTLNHFYDSANVFLNWLESTYQLENPVKHIKKVSVGAKYPDGPRAFAEDELSRLVAASKKWQLLYRLLAYTGLRRQEAKDLLLCDVIFDENPRLQLRAAATKSKRPDVLPLPPDLARDLAASRRMNWKPSDRVFRRGVAQNPSLKRDLRAANIDLIDKYGRPLGFHTFRRTFITMLQKMGLPPRVVMQLARHKNPNLTNWTYTDTTKLDLHSHVARLEESTKTVNHSSPGLSPPKTGNDGVLLSSNGHDGKFPNATTDSKTAHYEQLSPSLSGSVQYCPISQKKNLAEREGFEPPPGQQQKRFIKRGLCCL